MIYLKTAAILSLSLLTFAALAAANPSATPALAQSAQQVTLTEKEFQISPDHLTVPEGQPVQFTVTNTGTEEHNLVVEMEGRGIEQKLFATNLRPGETRTAQFTFSMAGDWEMYCPVDDHKGHGMRGEIEVMGATAPGMPSTGSPLGSPLWWFTLAALALALIAYGLLASFTRRANQ